MKRKNYEAYLDEPTGEVTIMWDEDLKNGLKTHVHAKEILTPKDMKIQKEVRNYMVRCVNSHEALLKAAKASLLYMKIHGDSTLDIRELLEKAIAQAEGRGS